MADPNWAAVAEMYAFAADVWDTFYGNYTAGVDTPLENLRNDIEGDWAQAARDGIDDARRSAADYLSSDTQQAVVGPIIQQWAAASGVPVSDDVDANWREVFDYMITNAQSFDSAEWSLGTPSAGGSNVGDSTVQRLNTDEEGEPMEALWPDTFELKAEEDFLTSGANYSASWRLRGTDAGPDGLPFEGAPEEEAVIPEHNDADTSVINNPTFTDGEFSGTTITSLTGWTDTAGDWSDFETNTTAAQIKLDTAPSGVTMRSLRFIANGSFYQNLIDTGLTIDYDSPWRIGVWVYREGNADGTFNIRLTDETNPLSGGITRAVTVSSLSNGAWTFIDLVENPGANNWPKNFSTEELTLSFQLQAHTTGSLYLSNVHGHEFTRIGANGQTAKGRGCNGGYISVISGTAQTEKGDVHTWTDSEAEDAVNQKWLGPRGANVGYGPSAVGAAETVLDK